MDAFFALQHGFASALASALLHSVWQCTLLALAAGLALAAMARSSAAARHLVAMLFLIAMVLAPGLQFLRFWSQPAGRVNDGWLPAMETVVDAPGVFVQQSSSLASVVVMMWVVGVGLMFLRHAGGLRAVRRMERAPYASLPPEWQDRVNRLRHALGIARHVAVRLTTVVVTPCAARVLRPVIWLPASLLMRMPVEQLQALLAHEMAHIARKDWLWNALQCVIEALLFFHPAAWWLGRRIRQEREHACDDLAVAACGDAIALAEALATLARQRRSAPLVLAANGGSLMQRIKRLLSAPPTRSGWVARVGLGIVLTGGILFVAQAGFAGNWRPQLHVYSSTEGKLGPGDVREIEANGADGRRFYRASIDAQGRLTEIYKRDGQVRPIDGDVRRWLAEVDRLRVVPPPPPPPPPAPAAPTDPPAPPAPPPTPDITASTEFKALMRLVAANPAVTAALGAPVALASGRVDGHISLDNGEGDADLRFKLSGARGSGRVHVVAELHKGTWTAESISLE